MELSAADGSGREPVPWRAVIHGHLLDMAAFARRPHRRPGPGQHLSRWCLAWLLGLGLAAGVDAFLMLFLADVPSVLEQAPQGLLWLSGVLIAPAAEELIFRAGLRNASYLMFVGPSLVAVLRGAWWVLWVWVLVAIVLLAVWRRRMGRPGGKFWLARRFSVRYPIWFWTYTMAFGLVHIGNYEAAGSQWLWLPLLVLPQITTGFFLGYLRVRNGLYSAMAAHFAHNLVAIGLLTWLR